jgi:cobalt-zinc-cadmium efflux system outer membrane protein
MRVIPWSVLMSLGLLAGCAGGRESSEPPSSRRASQTTARASRPPEELPANAGLDSLLGYAEDRNPGVQAAKARWHAAQARAPQERSLPDPQLMYEYWGLDRTKQQMLTVGLTVPWPGKLMLAGSAAEKEAEAERHRYQAARLVLAYRLKNAYFEHWYLARAIEIAKENAELAGSIEETARTRYKAAAAEFADVIKAQVELARMEDMVKELEAMRGPTIARLNAELDRPAEAPLPAPTQAPPEDRLAISDAEVLAMLEQASPELAAMDAEVAAARDAVALAKRGPIPDLMLKAGAMTMKQDGMERDDGPQLGVGITIPLWFGKYRAMRREADAKLSAAEFSRRDAANRLGSDAKMALFGLRDADRKAGLYRDVILPRAEQALSAAHVSYRAGKLPFAELIDSQRVLIQFRLDGARAVANRAQRLAEVEMLAGRELPKEPVPPAAGKVRKAESSPASTPEEIKP